MCFFFFQSYASGFHMLTHELRMLTHELRMESREHLHVALKQMFPASADEKVYEVEPLTESYHKYKNEYVKHLSFNPEEENLSK